MSSVKIRLRVVFLSAAKDLLLAGAAFLCLGLAIGCKPAPSSAPMVHHNQLPQYSVRPAIPPPPFKLFHQTDNSLTLVTGDNATDEQIESLVWQLHDAARNKSFDKLHLPQTFIDKRDPIVFIHIYRGTKCAAEKYAAGNPPCGGSYHAAGDYTLGSFKDPNRDDGVLLHDENHQLELWNPDAPSAAKAAQN
jgi:hypothetical protein